MSLVLDLMFIVQADMKVENNTEWKNQSSSGAVVRCSSEGEFLYPSPWPQVYGKDIRVDKSVPLQCSESIQCGAPPQAQTNDPRSEIDLDDI